MKHLLIRRHSFYNEQSVRPRLSGVVDVRCGGCLVWWMSYFTHGVVDVGCGQCLMWWMSSVVDVWCGGCHILPMVWWMCSVVDLGRPVSFWKISCCISLWSLGILLVYMVYSIPDILLPCMTLQLREFFRDDLHVSISTNCLRLVK